jgi:molybdate transport system substrate-binding protein
MNIKPFFISLFLMLSSSFAAADMVHVAVASNFSDAITTLSTRFEANTGYKVVLSFGSTGKHYAQIKNGAPFDVFLAADINRPKLLEEEGIAIAGTRFTYAIGKIVLWSPDENLISEDKTALHSGNFRYLAIANPKLAPYGKAAEEILRANGLWQKLQAKIVRGENVGQAYQYIKSGNAELGFIPLSYLKIPGRTFEGSMWEAPKSLYSPIEQQAVLLNDKNSAREFLKYLKSTEVQNIIQTFGYDVP